MLPRLIRLDDLDPEQPPMVPSLSRLHHQNSAHGPVTGRAFYQRSERFSQDEQQVRQVAASGKSYPGQPRVSLPPAPRWGGRKLRQVLQTRRTRRCFGGGGLSLKELGALLGLGGGVTGEARHPVFDEVRQPLRSWPSAGALYPLEVYWGDLGHGPHLEQGFYHHLPLEHALERLPQELHESNLWSSIFAQNLQGEAAGLVLLSAVWERTLDKYGERGYRFVWLDAGHLCQNLLLVAEDLGLCAVPLGGFCDRELGRQLGLPDLHEEAVIYAVVVGRPASRSRRSRR